MRACHCCGFITLTTEHEGSFEICPICFWEDDLAQYEDPTYEGGANKPNLTQARANFAEFGACERAMLPHGRPARPEEFPTHGHLEQRTS